MRHSLLLAFIAIAGLASRAHAIPFEPATVPEAVEVIGHLDVDALRKTQAFATLGGHKAIEAALDQAPADLRPLARALASSLRGVTLWRDTAHGAILLDTRDERSLAQLLAKLPTKRGPSVEGVATYTGGNGTDHGFLAALRGTLVLADTAESLERSLRVLAGRAPSLAGSSKLPAAPRTGVFVFVTIGSDALNAIQKSARSRVLQLAIKSLAVDVGEAAGVVTANARAEMGSAEAVQKARSILDGLRTLASLSDEPGARALIDKVTISVHGLALEVVAKLPVTELVKAIEAKR
jgi:hypothetical protein